MFGAVHVPVLPITIEAAGTITPYRFVGTDNNIAGAGANTIGVAMHEAVAGDDVTVETTGLISVETGGAVTGGGLVEVDATGRAIDRTAGAPVARVLDSSAAAGEFVRALLIRN